MDTKTQALERRVSPASGLLSEVPDAFVPHLLIPRRLGCNTMYHPLNPEIKGLAGPVAPRSSVTGQWGGEPVVTHSAALPRAERGASGGRPGVTVPGRGSDPESAGSSPGTFHLGSGFHSRPRRPDFQKPGGRWRGWRGEGGAGAAGEGGEETLDKGE